MLTLMAAKKGKSELRASRIELEASAWQAPRLLVGNDQLRDRIRKERTQTHPLPHARDDA